MTEKKKVTNPKKSEEEKVFDVTSPGKTIASAHSKPVIVTNRSVVRDPMVTPLTKTDAGSESSASAEQGESSDDDAAKDMPISKMRIEPLHEDVKAELNDEPEGGSEQETSASDASVEQADDGTTADDAQPGKSGDANDEDDEFGDIANDTKKAEDKAAAAEAAAEMKRREEAESAIASKQYFVPINAVQKRRSARALIIVAVVILILIGLLVTMDADVLDIGIDAPTDFIAD